MKIYTSYFGKSKKLQEKGIVMVSISLYPPKWYVGAMTRTVAPSNDILRNSKGEEDYTRRFKSEILSRVSPDRFINELNYFGRGKDIALCCFEKPGEFCHRHIVAEWLKEKLGIEVEEFDVKKEPRYVQGDLFAGM